MADAHTGLTGIAALGGAYRNVSNWLDNFRNDGGDPYNLLSLPEEQAEPQQGEYYEAPEQQGTYWQDYSQPTWQQQYVEQPQQQEEQGVTNRVNASNSNPVFERMRRAAARKDELDREEREKAKREERKHSAWDTIDPATLERFKNEKTAQVYAQSQRLGYLLPPGREDVVYESLSPETQEAMKKLGVDPKGFEEKRQEKNNDANQLVEDEKAKRDEFIRNAWDRQDEEVSRISGKKTKKEVAVSRSEKKLGNAKSDLEKAREKSANLEKKVADIKKKLAQGKDEKEAAALRSQLGKTQNELNTNNKNIRVYEENVKNAELALEESRADRAPKQEVSEEREASNLVIDPNANIHGMGEVWSVLPDLENTQANKRNLLTGGFDVKSFVVPEWLRKGYKKMSDDEKIEMAMRRKGNSLLDIVFQNRAEIKKEPKPSDYEKDYEEGKTEYGYYDSELSDRERAQNDAIDQQLQWIDQCYVPTEGQYIEKKTGRIRQSDRVENAINRYMNHMRLKPHEKWLVFHQVAKRLGYSPDTNNKFLLQEHNKVPDELFIQALNDLETATVDFKNPYHMFGTEPKYGGTKCFPVGVMTMREAEILCRDDGPLKNLDPFDAMSNARNDFFNYTLPEIRRVAHVSENGVAQMMVLNNYVRALCSLDSISPRYFGIAEGIDRGYEELKRECDPRSNPDADPEVLAERDRQLELAQQRRNKRRYRLDRIRNRTKSVYDEDVINPETGEVIHRKGERINPKTYVRGSATKQLRSSKVSPFDAACTFSCNLAKFMGVIGFTPVIVSGYVEHLSGNVNTSISNRILNFTFSKYYGNGDSYKVTDAMYDFMSTDEAIDAIKAWKALMRVGGQDAVALFREEYKVLSTDNARKFLNDCVNKESLFTGEKARIVKSFFAKINEGLEILLPGDVGFGKMDAKRWIEGFMINNMVAANSGSLVEPTFTSKEVFEMMQSMGVDGFLAAATDTYAGRDAAIMMRNSTLARESPLTHVADTILKRSGITNVVVTLGIDTYFTYGLNLIQAMLPFSNTVSYLTVKGINVANKAFNETSEDMSILEYQLGGLDTFGKGLVKNLLYDFVKIANVAIFGCLVAQILIMIGFDEPEDPGLKYRWDEYVIGKKIGLGGFDENGNPQGIPLYRAWWLDDLTLFGLPMAYAIASMSIKQKENDPDLSWKIFHDGYYDVLSGASALDLIRSIKGAERIIMEYDELMTDPNKRLDTDWISYAYMEFFELPLARAANKMFVPNFLRDMFRDEYEHTPYKTYNRDSTTPGADESVDDWVELQRRIESRYNPVYALWNNWWQNGYLFDRGDTQKTGYFYNEMPLAFEPDARKTSFLETKLGYIPIDDVPIEERDAYIEQKCDQLADMIENEYGWDVDKAVADGFTIPLDLRFEFRDYLQRRWNFAENVYNEAVQNGIRGTEKNQAWTDKENDIYKYKTLLNDWVFNTSKIPWSDKGYVRLRTDYETVYYNKNTGKPVPEHEYILEGPSDIEKRYVPRGNTPNSFALFTTPQTEGRGFNYETIASWFDKERSDLGKIFSEQQGIDPNSPIGDQPGKFAKYGYNKNVPLNSAMFGGNFSFPTNTPVESSEYGAMEQPTAGRRALEPFTESMLWDLPNYNGTLGKNGNAGTGGNSSSENTKDTNANIPENSVLNQLKSQTRENVDPGNLGAMGKYYDKDFWKTTSSDSLTGGYYGGSRGSYYRSGGSGYSGKSSSSYNPKIYASKADSVHVSSSRISSTRTNSNPRSINADRAATMYSKAPQDAKTSYLNPSFSTKGSREAYKRQDI